jgi:hypothetical protein
VVVVGVALTSGVHARFDSWRRTVLPVTVELSS